MNFKTYRVSKGIKQGEIADLLGIGQSAYSKKENNPDSFKPSEFLKITIEYNVDLKELYDMMGIKI